MKRREFITKATVTSGGILFLKKDILSPRPDVKNGYVSQIKPDVLTWLESVRNKDGHWGKWQYNSRMYRPYGLFSSVQGVVILDLLNEFDNITEIQKKQSLAFFMSCKDSSDGLFKDPLLTEADRVANAGGHSWEHIYSHMTAGVFTALELLGITKEEKPEESPFGDLRTMDVQEWLLTLNWKNPWLECEHVRRVIEWYWNDIPSEKRTVGEPRVDALLSAYEKLLVNPDTGMPTLLGCNDKINAMAGLFKIAKAYELVGREIPFAEKAIDFILDLQIADGSFADGGSPSSIIINWDALWLLRILNLQLEKTYKFPRIQDAGNQFAKLLLSKYRKPDGGFSEKPDSCITVHNSIKISDSYPISDTVGTSMSIRCLSYADEWNS